MGDKKETKAQAYQTFRKLLLWGYPEIGIPAYRLLKNRADEEKSEALTLGEGT